VWDSASPEEVQADFNRTIEIEQTNDNIDQRDAEAYCERGTAHYNVGEYDQAILEYNKAIEINPVYHKAYNYRGNCYYHKGEHDRAILDYNKALESNPYFAYAFNNRGIIYYYKGEYD